MIYKGERVVPSTNSLRVSVGGSSVNFNVDPKEKTLSVFVPLPKDVKKVPILLSLKMGPCSTKYSDIVQVVGSSQNISLILFLLVAGAFLFFVLRRFLA